VVTSKVSSTIESVGDLEKSKSVLKYTPSRSDNRYKIYCQAFNILGRTPVMSSKFQMDVRCKLYCQTHNRASWCKTKHV
jgi:hypothetical protein